MRGVAVATLLLFLAVCAAESARASNSTSTNRWTGTGVIALFACRQCCHETVQAPHGLLPLQSHRLILVRTLARFFGWARYRAGARTGTAPADKLSKGGEERGLQQPPRTCRCRNDGSTVQVKDTNRANMTVVGCMRECTLSCLRERKPRPPRGVWSEWSSWQDRSKCDALCGGGRRLQTKYRTCIKQSETDLSCRGYDHKNRTATCNKRQCGDLCSESDEVEITYLADPEDSHYYYECQECDDTSETRAVLLMCPTNHVWNQASGSCVAQQTVAPTTTVSTTTTTTTPPPAEVSTDSIDYTDNCSDGTTRADTMTCYMYEECTNSQWHLRTCSEGFIYDIVTESCQPPNLARCLIV